MLGAASATRPPSGVRSGRAGRAGPYRPGSSGTRCTSAGARAGLRYVWLRCAGPAAGHSPVAGVARALRRSGLVTACQAGCSLAWLPCRMPSSRSRANPGSCPAARRSQCSRSAPGDGQSAAAGRPGTGRPQGGSAPKRIRLILDVPATAPARRNLASVLTVPAQVGRASWTSSRQPIEQQEPTDDDFAAAVAALDALDRTGQAARRVEQSYLRRALFSGPPAACDLCGRDFEVEFLVAHQEEGRVH